jgi:hypothetical protein
MLTYDNKGLFESFIVFIVQREGSKVMAWSTLHRDVNELWTTYKKYTGKSADSQLQEHAMPYINSIIRNRLPLRTEPKVKNHVGPAAFRYLVHFLWVRDYKGVFDIGLDRLDDSTIRLFEMFTGARTHAFILPRLKKLKDQEYYDPEDAYTDSDTSTKHSKQTANASKTDALEFLQCKECWVCGRDDTRMTTDRKILCWEDIQLWILPDLEAGRDRLAMTVVLRFYKGHVKNYRPTRFLFLEENLPMLCTISHIFAVFKGTF